MLGRPRSSRGILGRRLYRRSAVHFKRLAVDRHLVWRIVQFLGRARTSLRTTARPFFILSTLAFAEVVRLSLELGILTEGWKVFRSHDAQSLQHGIHVEDNSTALMLSYAVPTQSRKP